jgi:hypothetical protein
MTNKLELIDKANDDEVRGIGGDTSNPLFWELIETMRQRGREAKDIKEPLQEEGEKTE